MSGEDRVLGRKYFSHTNTTSSQVQYVQFYIDKRAARKVLDRPFVLVYVHTYNIHPSTCILIKHEIWSGRAGKNKSGRTDRAEADTRTLLIISLFHAFVTHLTCICTPTNNTWTSFVCLHWKRRSCFAANNCSNPTAKGLPKLLCISSDVHLQFIEDNCKRTSTKRKEAKKRRLHYWQELVISEQGGG